MVRPGSPASPLDAVSADERATEAFELLGNETRLAILVALWEAYRPFEEGAAVRFSELRERVGTADSGRFNYHLDRLEGHFVESVDGGYRLTEAGLVFVRSVIAGSGIEDPTLEPSEVDQPCGVCGAAAEVAYENGWVYVRCTGCEGLWTDGDGGNGHLAKFSLHPAGLVDRTPEEIYAAAWVRAFQKQYSMIEGVCPVCTARVERTLDVCDDHDPDGNCPNCGRRNRTIGRMRCTVCKEWIQTTVGGLVKYHPGVVGFCYDRGLELQYGPNDLASIMGRMRRTSLEVELLSEAPPRVGVTTELDGDTFRLEIDEDLTVVDADG